MSAVRFLGGSPRPALSSRHSAHAYYPCTQEVGGRKILISFLFFSYLFIYFYACEYLAVCVSVCHVCLVSVDVRRGDQIRSPGTGVMHGCEPHEGRWKPNPSSL